jgi:hypothetical protein
MWGNVGGHNPKLTYFSSKNHSFWGGVEVEGRIQFESREKEIYELHGGYLKNSICHSGCLYFLFNHF